MKLRILGCSGGIGGSLRTTSMLLDDDILIDAGTGVGDLGLDELCLIDHIFITHAHLDHIACIPFLLDTTATMRVKPLNVYATVETLEALQQHIFNWKIWPDFSKIPNLQQPYMRYQTISIGTKVKINGRIITPLPANHVVPAVGFQLDSGSNSLVFTGDTCIQDTFWDLVNDIHNLSYLIVETAYSNAEKELALISKHLCPSLLAEELKKLKLKPQIYITHLKPGESELIMQEVNESLLGLSPQRLMNGQVFEL